MIPAEEDSFLRIRMEQGDHSGAVTTSLCILFVLLLAGVTCLEAVINLLWLNGGCGVTQGCGSPAVTRDVSPV